MDKSEPRHIYAENRIREAIRHLNIDDKLPGERVFAKELGISYMTIRKAVDNLVAKGILYRVAKKGTYVANPRDAQSTRNIGYFLDSSIKDGLTSPYYSLIFDALEKEATRNDYALIYFSDDGRHDSQKITEKLDGVIVSCFPRVEPVVQIFKQRLPVVCIDNRPADSSIPSLTIDNYNSVIDSINYLYSLGHERIGFITGLDDSDVGKNRVAGYLTALENRGIRKDMDLVFRGDYSFDTGRNGAEYFLSLAKRPTAIMCANDTMAIAAIKELGQSGLNVPDDMSVIGFDDISIASQITPALTTVSVPVNEIAKQAVNALRAEISGGTPDHRHITLPCRLVVRESCAESKNSQD